MNSDELPERLVIYSSRWKMGLVALGCAGFVVGCLAILILDDPSVVDYAFCFLGLAFFGWGISVSIHAVFKPATLILNRNGYTINAPLKPSRRIEWDDVSEIRLQTHWLSKAVILRFKSERRPVGLLFQFNRLHGIGTGLQSGWRMKPERIAETMRAFHARHERS